MVDRHEEIIPSKYDGPDNFLVELARIHTCMYVVCGNTTLRVHLLYVVCVCCLLFVV